MSRKELLDKVVEVATAAGDFIFNECSKISVSDIEEKSKNSLVTYVDKEAERMIVEQLINLIPDAGFIAEEGTSDKVGDVFNWIIDPLDGTTNFIHGLPNYSVSIGLKEKDDLVIGVVYEPNRKECFTAFLGGGAYLNGEPIKVSATEDLSNALFATGFPYYDYEKMKGYLEVLKELMQESRGIRRIGSAAIDLAYVACGRFEAFYEYSLNPWDVAAGALIVQEAGGEVVDFSGGNNFLFGKEIIASNGKLGGVLQKKIALHFKG